MYTYPPADPAKDATPAQLIAFLNSPKLVERRVNALAQNTFLSDVLLTGRFETEGAVLYEIATNAGAEFLTSRAPEAIAPGGEYPRASAVDGDTAVATVSKWGQDVPITDEAIRKFKKQPVDKGLRAVVNTVRRQTDSVSLAAVSAAVTKSVNATAAWTSAGANPFLDLELAAAEINDEPDGYSANVAFVTSQLYAYLAAKMASTLQQDAANKVVTTAQIPPIAGLQILPAPARYMPPGVSALVADSAVLGGLGYTKLPSPEYTGDPAYGVETWSRRDPDANDQWLVRGRRPVVPVIQEPRAARKLVGA